MSHTAPHSMLLVDSNMARCQRIQRLFRDDPRYRITLIPSDPDYSTLWETLGSFRDAPLPAALLLDATHPRTLPLLAAMRQHPLLATLRVGCFGEHLSFEQKVALFQAGASNVWVVSATAGLSDACLRPQMQILCIIDTSPPLPGTADL